MWESYYSTLKRLPTKLMQPASFVEKALPNFRCRKIRRILDLGCGVGRHCIYLAKNSFDIVGVDFSVTATKIADELIRKEQLRNVALTRATMTSLPFNDCSFDAVISISVIHHAIKKDILKTIREIYRVLRKDGVFLANLVSVMDPRYGTGKKVENDTFKILEGFEERRFEELHHFFRKHEVSDMLTPFADVTIQLSKNGPHYWKIRATK